MDAQGDVVYSMEENSSSYMPRSNEYVYDAYGNQTSGGTTGSAKNYRGEYYDSETGLYYLNARYYDPTTQQFTQEDTYWGDVKDPGSLNLYGYCEGNPVMSSDPTGHRTTADDGSGSWAMSSGGKTTIHDGTTGKTTTYPSSSSPVFENATVKQLHTYLSVRSCDSNSAKEIGKIFGGERVQCIRDGNNGYCYVRYHVKGGSKEGWVHAQYLVKDHAQSAAPKAAAKAAPAAKAKPAAVESSRNGSSGNEQSADNSSSVESPQSENSSINLIGFGLQLEIDIGCVTIGIEIVWYISSQVDVGGASRCIPYIYVYGGGGLGSSLDSIVSNILNNPSRLANPKSIFGSNSASASVFAIFGYSNFSNPNDYSGPFTSVSATVWNVKSYISWSSTCVVAGIGWSSSPFGASSSETDYYLMNNIDADFSNSKNYVYGQAQNIEAPY